MYDDKNKKSTLSVIIFIFATIGDNKSHPCVAQLIYMKPEFLSSHMSGELRQGRPRTRYCIISHNTTHKSMVHIITAVSTESLLMSVFAVKQHKPTLYKIQPRIIVYTESDFNQVPVQETDLYQV